MIDVHCHMFPSVYRRALTDAGRGEAGGIRIPEWTPELALQFMDPHGIETQVLSIADPALSFVTGETARRLAREINEYSAQLLQDRPDRFGALAVLPLPDVEGAVREATQALDTLGLDGVGVLSSYAGVYIGDPRFDPLLAALDERGAYVMVHPATPPEADRPEMGIPAAIVEYTFETTRAITNLIWKGAVERFPRIRWSFSHAGGAAPFLAYRITGYVNLKPDPRPVTWDRLARFYYDTALNPVRPAMRSVLEVAPVSHVLFGSDWPFTAFLYPKPGDPQPQLADTFDSEQLEAVRRDNALKEFPKLAERRRKAAR